MFLEIKRIILDRFGVDPVTMHLGAVLCTSMDDGFFDTRIRIFDLSVFSDDSEMDLFFWLLDVVHKCFPFLEIWIFSLESEFFFETTVHVLCSEHERNLIDSRCIGCLNNVLILYISKQRDLRPNVFGDSIRCSTYE